MNMRSTLILMAATMAPLCAQEPAAPQPAPGSQLSTLAAPTATPAATPAQRAAVFNALALLPANISDALVLPNLSENCAKLDTQLRHGIGLPEGIDNVALATTPATPETYALLTTALRTIQALENAAGFGGGHWAPAARPELYPTIQDQLFAGTMAAAQPAGAIDGQSFRIPATYAVLTVKPGHEAMLAEWHTRMLASMKDNEGQEGFTFVEDAAGFSGLRIELGKLLAPMQEAVAGTDDLSAKAQAALSEQFTKRTLHVLTRLQGHALIIALCEDPQELKLAATPEESALGTDLLASCDAQLGKGLFCAIRTSAALDNAYEACTSGSLFDVAAGVASVFTKLGETDAANKASYDKAATGLGFIISSIKKLIPDATKPSTLCAWCDGDLHIVAKADARGTSYTPGTLRLAAVAESPTTALYMESTPGSFAAPLPAGKDLLKAALDIAQGFALTLDDVHKARIQGSVATVQAFMPEIEAFDAAGATIGSGLDGHGALVLDSAHVALPPFAGTAPGTEADVPRLALYWGVSDRSKLAQGWNELLAASGQLAAKLGTDPAVISMLPIVPSQQGAVMSYSLALPFFTPDCVPNLSLTDKGMAMGSSAKLNAQLLESATGTLPFAGCVLCFKPAPVAKSLRSLATALDPTPEEAAPVAGSEVKVPSEACEACEASEEDICEPCLESQLCEEGEADCGNPQEEAAARLSKAAKCFESMSERVDNVNMSSTVADGLHTIKVDIKLK